MRLATLCVDIDADEANGQKGSLSAGLECRDSLSLPYFAIRWANGRPLSGVASSTREMTEG